MRILVLGGTGAMGEHLVDFAAARGMEVHVTSRTRAGSAGTVHYIRGDAQDEVFMQQILAQRWNAIVDFMVYTTVAFERRVECLLEATDQYFFLSSARVYAGSDKPIVEESPRLLDVSQDEVFLASDEYALAKARQENTLRSSGRRNWTIIRPYITYARERLQLGVLEKEAWLYRAMQGRSIVFSSDINEHFTTMTRGVDVAKSMVALIGEAKALGEAFHVTTAQAYEWKRILIMYLDVLEMHLGVRPRVIMADMTEFQRCHWGEYQVKYDRCFDRRFDNKKIGRFVDIAGFVDANEGLRECLKAFLERPSFRDIKWRYEAIKDRLAHERTPLREIRGLKNKVRYILYRYLKR